MSAYNENCDFKNNARGKLEFSPEEKIVWRDCKRESFLKRSMPLATMSAIASYMAIQKGYLKSNAKLGAVPKVVTAAGLGYLIGQFSYMKICTGRLMDMPNSEIGAVWRKQMGRPPLQSDGSQDQGLHQDNQSRFASSSQSSSFPDRSYQQMSQEPTDFSEYSDSDMEYNKIIEGLSEYSGQEETTKDPTPSQSTISYAERRQKNRIDYEMSPARLGEQSRLDSFTGGAGASDSSQTYISRPPMQEQQTTTKAPARKNKYGDIWDS